MDGRIVGTLLDLLEVFRPALTQPGFRNMLVLFVGWVLTQGDHAVTQALVVTAVAEQVHWERYHRFFSRGTWEPDELGRLLFLYLLVSIPEWIPIRIAIDDTLAPKKGPYVFGIGSHLDAVRSTKRHRVFCFGHCWVVLAVLMRVPFSQRVWALPVLFRLYRNKKECKKKKEPYRKKTELAHELLDTFSEWVGNRRVDLAADSAYCNDTVTRDLPKNFVLFGAMRPDAVLTNPPPPRQTGRGGRPRKRGDVLPKPEEVARDESRPWETCEAHLYGQKETVEYKTFCAQWYRACGTRLLRIVVVKVRTGTIGLRVFFSMDARLSVREILETYAGRWSLEVTFRELKQLLGFADSSARKKTAVLRVAPFVGLIYTALVAWFCEGAYRSPLATPPVRPWYLHKHGLSFADVLRAAQRAVFPLNVLDPRRSLANLQKVRAIPSRPIRKALDRLRLVA